MLKYTIFKTSLGYFGLLGSEKGISRTCLPVESRQTAKAYLLAGINEPVQCDNTTFTCLQKQITAYFEGTCIDFKNEPIILDGMSDFSRKILTTCKKISYSYTLSYSQLAKRADSPKAARAVGAVLSKNPIPLIIPCHRVVAADGKIGGFTAKGGINLKKKMLNLEVR